MDTSSVRKKYGRVSKLTLTSGTPYARLYREINIFSDWLKGERDDPV